MAQAALADLTCTKAMVHDSGRYIQHQAHQMQLMNQEIMALRAGNMHQHDIIMKKMNQEKVGLLLPWVARLLGRLVSCSIACLVGGLLGRFVSWSIG